MPCDALREIFHFKRRNNSSRTGGVHHAAHITSHAVPRAVHTIELRLFRFQPLRHFSVAATYNPCEYGRLPSVFCCSHKMASRRRTTRLVARHCHATVKMPYVAPPRVVVYLRPSHYVCTHVSFSTDFEVCTVNAISLRLFKAERSPSLSSPYATI